MRKRYKVALLILVPTILVLLALLFFVRSPLVIRWIAFPLIEKKTGFEITAREISFSPTREIILTDLTARRGMELHGSARRLACQYNLKTFLNGGMEIISLELEDAELAGSLPEYHIRDLHLTELQLHARNLGTARVGTVELQTRLRGQYQDLVHLTAGRLTAELEISLDNNLSPDILKLLANLNELQGQAQGVALTNRRLHTALNAQRTDDTTWNISNAKFETYHHQRLEAAITAVGQIAPDTSALDMHIHADPIGPGVFAILGTSLGGWNFAETNGSYQGHFKLAPEQEMTLQGNLLLHQLTAIQPAPTGSNHHHHHHQDAQAATDQPNATLPPLEVALQHDLSFAPTTKQLTIRAFKLAIDQENRTVVSVSLPQPLSISTNSMDDNTDVQSELVVNINQLDLRLVNPWLTDNSVESLIQAGQLTAVLNLNVAGSGRQITLLGNADIEKLSLLHNQHLFAELALHQTIDASLTELREVQLKPSETVFTVAGKDAAKLKHSGNYNMEMHSGLYQLEVDHLNQEVWRALPRALLRGAVIESFLLQGNLKFEFQPETVTAGGHIRMPQFIALDSGFGSTGAIDADLQFITHWNDSNIRIENFSMLNKRYDYAVAHLAADGNISRPISSGKSVLNVRSNGLDLDLAIAVSQKIQEMTRPAPAPAIPAASRPRTRPVPKPTPTEPKPPTAPIEPQPLAWDHADIELNLNLKKVRFAQLEAEFCNGQIKMQNNILRAAPLNLVLNGGAPVHLEAQIDMGIAGYDYQGTLNATELTLDPFLATFGTPQLDQQVDAHLKKLTLQFTGQGITNPNLKKNLKAKLAAEISRLHLHQIAELAEFAAKWDIPELRELNFNQIMLQANINNGICHFQQLFAQSTDLRINMPGQLDLDLNLNLKASIAVAAQLEKRLVAKGVGGLLAAPVNNYRALPMVIPVTGTLTSPKIQYKFEDFFRQSLEQVGKSFIEKAAESAAKGEKIDPKELLKQILRGQDPAKDSQTTTTPESPTTPDTTTTTTPDTKKTAPRQPRKEDLFFDILENVLKDKQKKE